MHIVLTGITGFIGRRLAHRLAPEHRLYAIVRQIPPVQITGVSYIVANIAKSGALELAVAEGRLPAKADSVIHLATSRLHREFPAAALDQFMVDVAAAAVLLDYARRAGAKQFILGSTGTVYEPYRDEPLSEDLALAPTSFFAAAKVAVERLMACYDPFFAPLSLRLFFPYGPGQTDRLIPTIAASVRDNVPIRLPIEGEGIRMTPIFIEDVIDVIEAAILEVWRGIINVASPEVLSLQQLAIRLAALTGRSAQFVRDPSISGPLIRPDLTRLAARVSLDRFVNVESGLQRMMEGAASPW
jgi:nucleoside-diphosphate-sugar epimerase